MKGKRSIPPLRDILASNLRAERARLRLTQEQLAEKAGLHPTYISRVEGGVYNVGVDGIERLAHALNVDPSCLLKIYPEKSTHPQ